MDGEEGSGIRLSKRFAGGKVTGGSLEVDYKTKAGTAWSHSFLNQKPWHPLSYPNQRRKWIAEQTHAQHERRSEEVAREFAQEQEFFRQTAMISKKDREKIEMMKAVSFMYVRPPGYDAESAKAAEMADPTADGSLGAKSVEAAPGNDRNGEERKKPRPKDVFGRTLPTEEEFEILKNAPRLETGVQGRAKPFAVEVRNVKCLRCGNYGHQSGDRECSLKDVIMPNEEVRLKRDDPLTAISAHTDPSEPLKWELKQKPGLSPPRGGFNPDDPNQQIVAEDIYDEYGGFLGDGSIPLELLNSITTEKKRKSKKNKEHKKHSSRNVDDSDDSSSALEDTGRRRSTKGRKHKKKEKKRKKSKKHDDSDPYSSATDSGSDSNRWSGKRKHIDQSEAYNRGNTSRGKHSYSSEEEEEYKKPSKREKNVEKPSTSSDDFDSHRNHWSGKRKSRISYRLEDDQEKHHKSEKRHRIEKRRKGKEKFSYESEDSDSDVRDRNRYRRRSNKNKYGHSHLQEDSDNNGEIAEMKRKYNGYSWEEESGRRQRRRRRSRSR